jgi:protein-disulfide isomerase
VRHILLALVLILGVTGNLAAPPSNAGGMPPERSLGSPTAPVTLIEYSSFTCPHCATFHHETLPQIRKEYIDTGKVRYVFHDFPLDAMALAASMTSYCVDPGLYFGFIDLLYRDQMTWSRAADPLKELETRAQLAGVMPDQLQACLKNSELAQGIQKRAKEASEKHDIKSTPSFMINGEKVAGAISYDQFKEKLDAALAKSR